VNFSQSEEERLMTDVAGRILKTECPTRIIRDLIEKDGAGFDMNLWRRIASLGWLSITVPEKYGGQGSDLNTVFAICQEMGREGLVSPFLSTGIIAPQLLLAGGNEAQRKEYMSQIVGGSIFAWAMQEADVENAIGLITTAATKTASGKYELNGTKTFVPYANVANYLLVLARIAGTAGEKGLTVFIVPTDAKGLSISLEPTIGVERLCKVTFNKVKLGSEAILGAPGEAAPIVKRALQIATVAKMFEMLGGMDRVLQMTIEYTKDRITWKEPIANRQAIQHQLADIALNLDLSRILIQKAAGALQNGLPADLEISMAKSFITEKYAMATKQGLQFHGAIAYCIDHDLQVFIKGSNAAKAILGSTDYHLMKVAEGIGL
jgi:alkylation response protein AidB-like acyl-CoA dehydrogenase